MPQHSGLIIGDHWRFTERGGKAISLINDTGTASVKGELADLSDGVDFGYKIEDEELDSIGVVYEGGVADGQPTWIVTDGPVQALLKNDTAAVHGNWVKGSATTGRIEATVTPSGIGAISTAEHFKEVGHCMESKSSGTDVLVWIYVRSI